MGENYVLNKYQRKGVLGRSTQRYLCLPETVETRKRPELIIFPKFLPYDDDGEEERRGDCLISEKQERIKWK